MPLLLILAVVYGSSGGTYSMEGYKWQNDFFKTSSEHIQRSGCRQLFTSVTKPRYTKLSTSVKRWGRLDINVLEGRILRNFAEKFWIKATDTLFTEVENILFVHIIK
jgi:hypothetical protein